MSFRITRATGLIGILAFVLWFSIRAFSPIESECRVEYYGTPDFHSLAENVLDLQTSSYHVDYNYHRALRSQECLNTRFDCEVTNRIDYLGGDVIENQIDRDVAITSIQSQIEQIYEQNGLAELRVNWSAPIIGITDFDYPSPDFGITGEMNCTAVFEISNDLGYEAGDSIVCFVPPFGSECQMTLERHLNLDEFAAYTAYVSAFCIVAVMAVTVISLIARYRKRKCSKRNNPDSAESFGQDDYGEEEFEGEFEGEFEEEDDEDSVE
jgi:hypothetical protein